MKTVHLTTCSAWRRWLARHHATETAGVWLLFHQRATGKPILPYEDAVREALCFGWIDSIIRRIDDERYCRKFTPRRPGSRWSALNRRRAEALIAEKRMAPPGQAAIDAAKRAGRWNPTPASQVTAEPPGELQSALAKSATARTTYERLSPSRRRAYNAWIAAAKRPETRARRTHEAITRLRLGKPLGLK